jgi:hypothetical protein
VESRISIGPGIEVVEPCPCQGAPKAVFLDALPFALAVERKHFPLPPTSRARSICISNLVMMMMMVYYCLSLREHHCLAHIHSLS